MHFMNPKMSEQIAPALAKGLGVLRREILDKAPMWDGDFFTAIQNEPNAMERYFLLQSWVQNMMAASYGFIGYVPLIMAYTLSPDCRYIASINEREELGENAYPKGMHYYMIHELNREIGTDPKYIGNNPNNKHLLSTTKVHVLTHMKTCATKDLLIGLGMLYFIECLTATEFTIVGNAYENTWRKAYHDIQDLLGARLTAPIEHFDPNGRGRSYFWVNIVADSGKNPKGKKITRGHDYEMMMAIQAELLDRGININHAPSLKPHLQLVADGMLLSRQCRTNFTQGAYDAVRRNPLEQRFALDFDGSVLTAANNGCKLRFDVNGIVPHSNAVEGGSGSQQISISTNAHVTLGKVAFPRHDLLTANYDIANVTRAICQQGKRDNGLPAAVKLALENLARNLPKEKSKS